MTDKISPDTTLPERMAKRGPDLFIIDPLPSLKSPIKKYCFMTAAPGFSLVELLVVIVIIGILAALVAPRLIGRTDKARITEANITIKNLETGLRMFIADNGFYPSTEQGLKALVEMPSSGQIPDNYRQGGYLEKREVPADPWGRPYIYISPGENRPYDIISYGADGLPGGDGYNADIVNWDI